MLTPKETAALARVRAVAEESEIDGHEAGEIGLLLADLVERLATEIADIQRRLESMKG